MTADPTGGPGLPRRRLLTIAALAALPAACSTVPAEPVATAPLAPSTAAPSASAAASAAPSASPSVSATASATPARPVGPSASADATTAVRAATPKGGPVPFRAGRAMLGSYLGLQGLSMRQSLDLRRRQLGRDQRIVHAFNSWDSDIDLPDVPASSTVLLSWNGTRYTDVTGGSADRRIAAAARRFADHGRPVMLRWAWEMNGDWFDWGGARNGQDTAGYVRAWRRIHRIFRDNGADNVAFVWSPNWNSGPDAAWNRFTRYYPGDAYVDWVGVSGYDFDGESPRTLFTPIVSAYGTTKPIIITETAAIEHGGSSKADWIRQLSTLVKATPAVGGVVWFDTDTHDGGERNFRFDTSSASLAAYRTLARGERFAG